MNLFRLAFAGLVLLLFAAPAARGAVPGASTGPATDVTFSTATLTGVVNPNKEDTVYAFEYGTTTAYGARTPDRTAGGNAGKDVAEPLTGLTPSTLYHFRLVVLNASGSDTGADMTFTTAASPYALPPTVTIAATPTTVRFGSAAIVSGRVAGAAPGTTVVLQSSPHPFGAFTDSGTVATDAAGDYSFVVEPGLNTRYRVVVQSTPPATSAEVTVSVRHRVGLGVSDSKVERGQRVRFKGSVAPAHVGSTVRIQRRSSKGFKTIAKTVLRKASATRSTYAKRIRITRKGTYRTVVAADADHAKGISPKRKIRIG